MKNKNKKYCAVPRCFNSTVITPEKLFFNIPIHATIRKKWMTAIRRQDSIGPKTVAHCCEDHFDMEKDMDNYVKHNLIGERLKLKKEIVPHKFACQNRLFEKPERPVIAKLKLAKLKTKLLTATEDLTENVASTLHDIEQLYIVDPIAVQVENIDSNPLEDMAKDTTTEASSSETFAGPNLCRVCMEDDGRISLFSWEAGVQRCAKMMKCAAVEVSEEDGLPDSICQKCDTELAASYQFAVRCEASDNTLRSRTELVKQEPATEQSDNDTTHEYKANMQYSDESIKDEAKLNDYYNYDHTEDNSNTVQINIEMAEDLNENKHQLNEYENNIVDVEKRKTESMSNRRSQYIKGCIQCPKCEKLYSKFSAFDAHMKSHEPLKQFTCDMCKKCFSSKVFMEKHKRGHYGVKRRKVQKTFIEKKSLRPETMCYICGRTLSSLQTLKQHIETHSSNKPFTCEYCGINYKMKFSLKDHQQNAHPDLFFSEKYICDYCGITVYSKAKMNYHMKLHMPSKWFKCTLCPKMFPYGTHLNAHQKQHSSIKQFKCQSCSSSFHESYRLQRHCTSVHKNERNFICKVCNKGYKSTNGLKTHMVSHSKEKPWMCSVCGKTFNLKCNMVAHTVRVHSKKSNNKLSNTQHGPLIT